MKTPAPTWSRDDDGNYWLTEYAPTSWWRRRRPVRKYVIPELTMLDIGQQATKQLLERIEGLSQ